MEKETYLTIKEAAKILRVDYEVLRKKIAAGQIKTVRPLGMKILIPQSEMKRVLNT